ncbi:hypothetical protein LAJ19_07870 [Deinococcus taeanensis]|uniref:hypothetical protein n=1 Tax=Deinococcus taeanensis TaxID=2737050 RepID=UPI001CDD0FD6|nr:hypothetical protein [Deinococcus taeanensis]UBV41583.1 hypothetical protein LAJ19_07870 [Deinococcus taeanensis]
MRFLSSLIALGLPLLGVAAGQPVPALSLGPVRGVQLFMGAFQPGAAEGSLLAYARREGLDWTATQNLFAVQVTDDGNHFLDWRGVGPGAAGPVFTVVRAATYVREAQALLVLNREWCQGGRCEQRSTFAWLSGGALRAVPEPEVIPLIRDQDFFAGRVPACLRGVTLGVQYVPSRVGITLAALPVVPDTARRACEASGVNLSAVTRPRLLNWTASVGKFRW